MSFDLNLEIAKDVRKQAFLRDEGRCRYCHLDFLQSLSAFWSHTVDHVISKSAGGEDTLENIVISCKACSEALCRAGHLQTIEERTAYIKSREADRAPIFHAWVSRLGRDGSLPR